ncbi:TAT-variant-translocated molybdopterin oxidoreductase [Tianweitania populi]|uniref:Molybdopterin oxidoreductase n=1 Tax=Tianweitania populi TaxID=1607949 RepID=A0A8J3DTQ2_9HYPH|nr:TAT-variant-translocated molybdopterin oxidoreductase [Tianweitania populi]GHD05004.1 molybdopterin oxidoreductase [Tianweitania populi]
MTSEQALSRSQPADKTQGAEARERNASVWRSLDEWLGTKSFKALLEAEFPSIAPAADGINRRSLLQAMGASLALAGLTGCSSTADETALPYVEMPEGETQGIARFYATAVSLAGYAQPVFGKTYSGRPVKLEGNASHPASRGAIDAFTQAALLGLYDPSRSQAPRLVGEVSSWSAWERATVERASMLDRTGGEGFRLLTGRLTSPTLQRQISEMMARWPQARWHSHEPVDDRALHAATRLVFGRPLDRHLRLDRAEVIVSFDDDLLGPGPRQVRQAKGWSDRRMAAQRGEGASLLFVAEPTPSLTGIAAGDRLIAAPARFSVLVANLANALGVEAGSVSDLSEQERRWVQTAAERLQAYRGRALVSVGTHLSPEMQALALLINERLGNLGQTLAFTTPIAAFPPDGDRSLEALVEDMRGGRVSTLAILGTDPVATAPSDLSFAEALDRVELRIHAGLHVDATANRCHWHAPLQHELESWTDLRAVDGTVSIVQPLVKPFWSVRSIHTVLENLGGRLNGVGDQDVVRKTWLPDWGIAFDANWRSALLEGFVAGSAPRPEVPPVVNRAVNLGVAQGQGGGLTLLIQPDPTIFDGRFSKNAWLQELPKPITKICWGNAVLVSPALAAERQWTNGDGVRVSAGDASVEGAIWIVPGQARDTVVVHLGYGKQSGLAGKLGFDAYQLRRVDALCQIAGVTLEATGEKQTIVTTQPQHAMDGFDFVRKVQRAELAALEPLKTKQPSFYPAAEASSPSWGMSIDLDLCIGCNACVTACQSENNIPVVGKDLVAQGREMHWLRVDHYYEGDPDDPDMAFQPVPCMHCEQAPCEMGCPVNAAVHSYDGLNLQVYNRCIGTRTCSSYCPYKVRRFNWFDFTQGDAESVKAMRNPEVTVRQRGVMEKCTYCIQRIEGARIQAKKEGREIAEGEVVTACQAACPTTAITFGNVMDNQSAVSRRKAEARDYALLEEVNTRPRTTYLARILDDEAQRI